MDGATLGATEGRTPGTGRGGGSGESSDQMPFLDHGGSLPLPDCPFRSPRRDRDLLSDRLCSCSLRKGGGIPLSSLALLPSLAPLSSLRGSSLASLPSLVPCPSF